MDTIDLGDLNDWRYFALVVESGGFSAAARALGLPKSRLSRRVSGLEARLGVRLLQRSTRRLTLTDVGREVLAHAQSLVREAEAAQCLATAQRAEPSGLVRLSLPPNLLNAGLAQVLNDCLRRWPRLGIEMVLTPRRVDLIAEGVDVALRVRAEDDEDPQWATLRLGPALAVLVASPELLARHGAPSDVDALKAMPALGSVGVDRRVHWRLLGPAGELRDIGAPPRLICEDFGMRASAALAGLGATVLPEPIARQGMAEGRLVPVLPGWDPAPGTLQAVYPTQRGLSPAVRELLDALRDAYRPPVSAPA